MATIEDELKDRLDTKTLRRLGDSSTGGCISGGCAYEIDNGAKIFVKKNCGEYARVMFDGEYESLKSISMTRTVKVPKPMAVLNDPKSEFTTVIAMEYLDLHPIDEEVSKTAGEKLASLHEHNLYIYKVYKRSMKWVGRKYPGDKASSDSINFVSLSLDQPKEEKQNEKLPELEPVEKFGFCVPTSCGALPQVNEWCDGWVEFFARHRLDHQINMIQRDYGDRVLQENWSKLQCKIDRFFQDLKEEKIFPSLLHGDLWSGNIGCFKATEEYEPVVYDPASFYGHSEYDLGIAKMFGGISNSFYEGYFSQLKQRPNFEQRNKLYQLFHHLNHWNHFGKGYRSSTIALIQDLNKQYQ